MTESSGLGTGAAIGEEQSDWSLDYLCCVVGLFVCLAHESSPKADGRVGGIVCVWGGGRVQSGSGSMLGADYYYVREGWELLQQHRFNPSFGTASIGEEDCSQQFTCTALMSMD